MEDGQPIPYGSWQSPITSDLIVSGGIGLGLVGLDGDTVYWAEARCLMCPGPTHSWSA